MLKRKKFKGRQPKRDLFRISLRLRLYPARPSYEDGVASVAKSPLSPSGVDGHLTREFPLSPETLKKHVDLKTLRSGLLP